MGRDLVRFFVKRPAARAILVTSLLCAWAGATALAAQEPGPASGEPAAASNRVVYGQDFFARFEPNNAEDMLRRIPGVPAILDAATVETRGFGSGGAQILLNGRRFPGKANEITSTLRRVPAGSVERVELITGASSDINVQSQGMVINVVMRPGTSIGGAGSWELKGVLSEGGHPNVDGLVAYNGTRGAFSYGLGVERHLWAPAASGPSRWSFRTRDEVYFYPNGVTQELRAQDARRTLDKWIFTGNLGYEFASGDRATLNGLFESRQFIESTTIPVRRFSPTGAEVFRALEFQGRDSVNDTIEIGGEYVSSFGPGDFSGLFIVHRENGPVVDYRLQNTGVRVLELSRSESRVKLGEDIVRGVYVAPLARGRSLEIGAESARNTLKQGLLFFGDTNADGLLEQIVINSSVPKPEVKELRGEAFAVFKWQVSEALSVDSSLNYEYSKLTTNYPSQPERQLGFFKPRLDARFRPTSQVQVRLLIERKVGQLDFANFVPRYNVDDQLVESGNPGLEPEKIWNHEVGYERRLRNDGGLINLRGFYENIADAIDRFPFCRVGGALRPVDSCLSGSPPPASRLDSAFGNIDSAKRYGAEAKASLRLGFVGLEDAVLSLRGERVWSKVRDPFTNEARRLAADRKYAFDIGFRHDLTRWRTSYGFDYRSLGLASVNSDLPFREYFETDPTLEAFVERKLTGALTLRVRVENLTRSHERRSRYHFNVAADRGAIARTLRRVDYYEERRDIRGTVSLRSQF